MRYQCNIFQLIQGSQEKDASKDLTIKSWEMKKCHCIRMYTLSVFHNLLLCLSDLWGPVNARPHWRQVIASWIGSYNTICPTPLQWNTAWKTRRKLLLRMRMIILESFLVRDERVDSIPRWVMQMSSIGMNSKDVIIHRWTFLFGFAAVWRSSQYQCMAR